MAGGDRVQRSVRERCLLSLVTCLSEKCFREAPGGGHTKGFQNQGLYFGLFLSNSTGSANVNWVPTKGL